jgi:hypothetical protein
VSSIKKRLFNATISEETEAKGINCARNVKNPSVIELSCGKRSKHP